MLALHMTGCILALVLGIALDDGRAFAASGDAAQDAASRDGQPPAPAKADASHNADTAGPPTEAICKAIASAAARNDLPLAFLTRLIWQESRFDAAAISSKGARGVAQFMPHTALWRGLHDPFDPIEAIPKAAELLAELRREFGSLGLAAAAYNAGPGRVREWMAKRGELPRETRAYVRVVTGLTADEWAASAVTVATADMPPEIPCRQDDESPTAATALPAGAAAPPQDMPNAGGRPTWGVQLIGSPSEAVALAAWHQLQRRYKAILDGRQPMLIHTPLAHGSFWHRVRVGTSSLASANALCTRLRGAGATCLVQRN